MKVNMILSDIRNKYISIFSKSLLIYLLVGCGVDNTAAKKVKLNLKAESYVEKSSSAKKSKLQPQYHQLDSIKLNEVKPLIKFYGFDKNASSSDETFFIVNNSDIDVKKLDVTIIYSDMQNRMLHRREETIDQDIPANETRMVSIRSFERQHSLYYYKSKPPRKGGMPFKVEIFIRSVSESADKPE